MENREQFAKDNFNLIYTFLDSHHIRYREDEIIDILYIGYCKALNIYDKEKGEFSTIAFSCMKNEYLAYRRYLKRLLRDENVAVVSLNSPVGENGDEELADFVADDNVNVEEKIQNKILFEYLEVMLPKILTRWQRTVFEEHYKNNMSIDDIAKKYGKTKQVISLIKKKAILKLRKYFNSGDDFELPPPSIEHLINRIINNG